MIENSPLKLRINRFRDLLWPVAILPAILPGWDLGYLHPLKIQEYHGQAMQNNYD